MKVFITGGVGFIGTNAALFFARLGHDVLVLDNFSRVGVDLNAAYIKKKFPKIRIIQADVQDINLYVKELKEAEVIIHLAGQTAVTTSIQDPKRDFDNNLQASFSLLEAVRENNPSAVLIYSSTNKVYGNLAHHQLKKNEDNKVYDNLDYPNGVNEKENLSFISPYGCSKGATDQYFLDYSRTYKLKTVVFRQSCIYGQFQMGVEDQGWLAHFTKSFLQKKKLNIYGDGYQVRDLLYVDDLLRAYQLAIENIDHVHGQVFNIGGGVNNAYSLLNVVNILEKKMESKLEINYFKSRKGDQKYFVSNNEKLKHLLGWQVKIGFNEGVDKLIDWQKEYIKNL